MTADLPAKTWGLKSSEFKEKIIAATLYTLEAVEQTINNWIKAGGQIDTVEDGTLGWGLTICHGEGLKTAIITEVPLNEWSSAHTIRVYKKMPKKYRQMLEDMEN